MSKQPTFQSRENKTNLLLPFLSSFAGMLAAIPISMVVSSTIVNAGLERQLSHLQPTTSQVAPLVSQDASSCVAPVEETEAPAPQVTQTAVLGASTHGHVFGTSHKKHHGGVNITGSFINNYSTTNTTNNTYTKNINSNNVVDSYNYEKNVTKIDTTLIHKEVNIKDSFNKDSYNKEVNLSHEETNVNVITTNVNSNNEVNNTTNNTVNSNNETNVNSKNDVDVDVDVKVEDSFNPVTL